jgi:hypothetical protein
MIAPFAPAEPYNAAAAAPFIVTVEDSYSSSTAALKCVM